MAKSDTIQTLALSESFSTANNAKKKLSIVNCQLLIVNENPAILRLTAMPQRGLSYVLYPALKP